jgi:hypothetical protein
LIEAQPEEVVIDERIDSVNLIDSVPSVFGYDDLGRDDAVKNLITCGAIIMISGDAGSGKSTFVTALCDAVANGTPFLGLPTDRRKVLYLDYENSLPRIQERFKRLKVKSDGPNSRLKYVGMHTFGQMFSPASPEIVEWAEDCKPIIVIDSFRAAFAGKENSSEDVRKFFLELDKLKNAGAAVILLHHTGKAETTKDYRGSSDIKAAIDVGYTLVNDGGTRLTDLTLTAFKMRFEVVEELHLKYDNGTFVAICPQYHGEDAIWNMLAENGAMIQTELQQKVMEKHKITRATFKHALNTLEFYKAIFAQDGPHNSKIWNTTTKDNFMPNVRNSTNELLKNMTLKWEQSKPRP